MSRPCPSWQRWVTLFLSWCVLLTAGCAFTFSQWSVGFNDRFHFTSGQLNIISGIGMAALYIPCLFLGILHDKRGPNITMFVGTCTFFLGFLCMWMLFEGKWGHFDAETACYLLSFFYFLTGIGSSAAYMAAVGVNVVNFPIESGGKATICVMGTLMLCYGLSGTLFSQIFLTFFGKTSVNSQEATSKFLFFTSIFVGLVNLVASLGMKQCPKPLVESIETIDQVDQDKQVSIAHSSSETVYSVSHVKKEEEQESQLYHTIQPYSSPWQMLKDWKFWVYIMVFFWQQGLAYINNVSSIVQTMHSMQDFSAQVALHLTVISISQSISRLLFAILSDSLRAYRQSVDVKRRADPLLARTWLYDVNGLTLLFISQIVCWIPHIILSFFTISDEQLLICSSLVGIGFGMSAALAATVTRDLFGVEFYGTAIGCTFFGIPVGIITSNLIYGIFLDKERKEQQICIGKGCFETSMKIFTLIQILPVCLSLLLYIHSVKLNRK